MKAFDLKKEDFKSEQDFFKAKLELAKKEIKRYRDKSILRTSVSSEEWLYFDNPFKKNNH